MTMRSLVRLLFVASTAAATTACTAQTETMTGTSRSAKSPDKGDDDDDSSASKSKTKTSPSPSSSGSATTTPKTSTSTPAPTTAPAPSTSTTSTTPPSGGLKSAGNELNACLTGCADENCANQCFADFGGNLAGGSGGGANLPCCTPGGGLFLCPLGTQCGDTGCKPLPLLDGFCAGQ